MAFTNYVVSFIDLLGQSEKLLATPRFVPPESDTAATADFRTGVDNTFIPTTKIQRDFEAAFAQLPPPPEIKDLSKESQRAFSDLRKNHVKFQRFSDGHVAYLNLRNKYDFGRAYNISRMITSCCFSMIGSLSRGHPIRGGIAIGWGIEFEKNFYGAVIARAHKLESQIACYPRIVIDTYIIQYLEETAKVSSDDSALAALDRQMASEALAHLCQDEYDGQWILDYLNPFLVNIYKQGDALDLVKTAYAFVKSEHKKYKTTGSSPNSTLAMRYAMMDRYFIQRLSLSGIPA